ncbi:hypothetical protein PV328_002500 [Microctonus aethiopoides]|uniref:Uncharacterized protein n=1 Tax=Microctonus aethiopoides TaxID=144406 RepID=A0AA39F6F3_9HYME|nr:hypothetical protein PV328_002500 [Microctonus aethiopoides]
MDLILARAREVVTLNHAISNPKSTKLIFQKLPIHMRRRAMSHNPKRMPIKLRDAHIRQMQKSGLPPKSKRPSRKYRRRPNNLLNEYNRRQCSKVWLKTHIWHAKRFHMIEKWGYKIAHYNNSRGYRANYKAITKDCMIQDISYYNCVEIIGPGDKLIEILKTHCKDGLTFGAKYYLKGDRQGSLTFYKKNGNPIGVVNFFYRPNTNLSEFRTIWIWIHPALYNEVIEELILSFEFIEVKPQLSSNDKFKNKFYHNNCDFKMQILTHSLNRFRLYGHMSSAVLTDTLRLPKLNENTNENGMETDAEESWYDKWYKESSNIKSFTMQRDIFNNIKTLDSPSQLPRHCVIGLTVLDPRFYCPPKKSKPQQNSTCPKQIYTLDSLASFSGLWETSVRDEVELNCKTTKEINDIRSGNLVPGVGNDSEYDEKIISKIPVILIQFPGTSSSDKSSGFTSGLDIILPAKWGLPFWLSFMYRCPRPGGLNESRSMFLENLLINSPEINHPDTLAYACEAEEIKKQLIEKYFRYPPNRRVNFIKYAISSPFYCEWKMLVKEWTNEEIVSVLRDRNSILSLTTLLNDCTINNKRNMKRENINKPLSIDDEIGFKIKSLLTAVKVTIVGKGNPKDFALICLPTDEDLIKFNKNKKWGGPIQKCKFNVFEAKRKILKEQHEVFLKRAMRQRKNARKSCKEITSNFDSTTIVTEHAKTMKNLYLPECTGVRESCDRQVIGYVVQGGFSCSEARGIGWGYVVIAPLLDMIGNKNNIVLVRNTKSRQYRCAKLQILPIT